MTQRELALKVAWKLYGTPYIWGGDDTILGFDCSGDIVEILKSAGALPHIGDWTGNDLWLRCRDRRRDSPAAGRVVCYGTQSKITHVMLCLSEAYCIGATGGGSTTVDSQAAAQQNAFVKVRPVDYRNDIVGYFDPFEEE